MDIRRYDYPRDVLRDLNAMRERLELTDVVLEVEGISFPCHRDVLASCSPYFRTMFTSRYTEAEQGRITIQEVSQVAMAAILDYAFSGLLKTEPDQVQTVMSAARLLQVDHVYHKATEYMKDHLDVFNCADVLMYADMLGDISLQEASGRYMASRFSEVVQQPSFCQLSLFQLQFMLNRDDLIVSSENDIVQAAIRWTEFDREERLQHFPALRRSFRHPFIISKHLEELESQYPSTDGKLVYGNSTNPRMGWRKTEMLVFFRKEEEIMSSCSDPSSCYDPYRGELHMMNMPKDLKNFSMTVTLDGELYLVGYGYCGTSRTKNVFCQYNHLLSTWEPRCDMISTRTRCDLLCLKGYIYAIGGDDTKKSAERYDPSCDEWMSIAPIPCAMLSKLCAVALDDNIYVLSKEGCYCYSVMENTWSRIADMLKPLSCPQAVTHQGCIYCVDCDKLSTCVEVYNPKTDTWKHSGDGKSFRYHIATLMPLKGALYLLTVLHNSSAGKRSKMNMYQYQPEEDSWQVPESPLPGRMIFTMRWWLHSFRRTDCLVARMIPQCLGDASAYKVRKDCSGDEEGSDDYNSDGSYWWEYSSSEEEFSLLDDDDSDEDDNDVDDSYEDEDDSDEDGDLDN